MLSVTSGYFVKVLGNFKVLLAIFRYSLGTFGVFWMYSSVIMNLKLGPVHLQHFVGKLEWVHSMYFLGIFEVI